MDAENIQYALEHFKNDEPGMRKIYGDVVFDTIVECLEQAQLQSPATAQGVLCPKTLRECAKNIRKNADALNDDYILYYLYSEAATLETKAQEIEKNV